MVKFVFLYLYTYKWLCTEIKQMDFTSTLNILKYVNIILTGRTTVIYYTTKLLLMHCHIIFTSSFRRLVSNRTVSYVSGSNFRKTNLTPIKSSRTHKLLTSWIIHSGNFSIIAQFYNTSLLTLTCTRISVWSFYEKHAFLIFKFHTNANYFISNVMIQWIS